VLFSRESRRRILAIAFKDAAELARQPGAILPAAIMVLAASIPAFLVAILVPAFAGESLEETGEFAEQARAAVAAVPALAGLSGNALVQAFIFHQFALFLLLIPIVGATALATHAVVGEKQSKALEPLLATPITTAELLAGKTLTPLLFALLLTAAGSGLYLAGILVLAEPGVWRAVVTMRTLLMMGVLGPLVALASLQLAVVVSSRAADPRSAQQLSSLLILPVTLLFIAQLTGAFLAGIGLLAAAALGCAVLNVGLAWIGIRVFARETILMRWK
jgi:ABC-2 type transport system permease protein